MPTHFGTHTDAYSHFLPAGRTIDRMRRRSMWGRRWSWTFAAAGPDHGYQEGSGSSLAAEQERAASCSIPVGENGEGLAYFKDFPVSTPGGAMADPPQDHHAGLDLPSVHPKEYKKVHEILFVVEWR